MKQDRRKPRGRRKRSRRRLLSEGEFRKVIETGKTSRSDQRQWQERRKKKRRRKVMGI